MNRPVCARVLLRRVANQSANNNTEHGLRFEDKWGNLFTRIGEQSESNVLTVTHGSSLYRRVPAFRAILNSLTVW